jgi:putative acetyltransferase
VSMVIRPATPADRAAVERVASAAFGEEGPTIVRLLRALEASEAVRASLVADADGEVVGHVQLDRSWVDARKRLVDVLVLSPLSVAPGHQGRGVGTSLLEAAVAEAERLGAPALFLEGDWTYYGRRGFEAATPLGFTRPSPRVPEPAFQVRLLAADEPWVRGPLVYCEAFWATDTVGLRDPFLAEVEARVGVPPCDD